VDRLIDTVSFGPLVITGLTAEAAPVSLSDGTSTFGWQGLALELPLLIRDAFALLGREEEDALLRLAALRTLRGWLGEQELAALAAARAQDYSWEEIGRAQGRPRQAVQRQARRRPRRPRVPGLTAPDFVGVATPELQVWLRFWSAPERRAEGREEAARDPKGEQERIRAELRARAGLGGAGPGRPPMR
jgi:hypothetical protein